MSKLRSVNTHFWNDNYVIDLDPLEKLLFLYLVTNANTNMLGIYELHIRKIAFETGIDKDMVVKIFDRFAEANKIKYKDGYVILANFLKNQSFNTNMEISAIKSWNELPLSIRQDSFCEPIAKGLKGFTKASEPIAEYELELEEETEVEDEEETEPADGGVPPPPKKYKPSKEEIETIYKFYPRKVGKGKAIKAIEKSLLKLRDSGERNPYSWLLHKVQEYAESDEGKGLTWKGTQPHPSTWFNEERFLDDPKEWEKQNKSKNETYNNTNGARHSAFFKRHENN